MAHLVLPPRKANAEKPKEPVFMPTLDKDSSTEKWID
jgi:hypothetical protein